VRAEQAAITAYAPSLVSRSAVSGVCVVLLCIFLDSHVDCTPKFAGTVTTFSRSVRLSKAEVFWPGDGRSGRQSAETVSATEESLDCVPAML
jgi:hypothetical protein